jgi:hypothetical protein
MGPPGQGSPIRQIQYSAPEGNYNSLPATNQTQAIYAYPSGATSTYSVPTGYIIQHPHQAQLIDAPAIPESKPPTVESQPSQNQESLGRVTVSGPGIVSTFVRFY